MSLFVFLSLRNNLENLSYCIGKKLVLGNRFKINVVSDNPRQTSKLHYAGISIFYSRRIDQGVLERLRTLIYNKSSV